VNIHSQVLEVLDDTLALGGRAQQFTLETRLFGSLPELDSMAVVDLIASLEDRFAIVIEEDEINARVFATVATLEQLVQTKLSAAD
jgi:acyl carrier protein